MGPEKLPTSPRLPPQDRRDPPGRQGGPWNGDPPAMRYAIASNFDYLINLDADFSHPPRFIPALLDGMGDHDVMIGSRYVPGGGVEGGFTLKRELIELRHQRLCPSHARSYDPGQQRLVPVLRVSKLAEIDLDQVQSRGYSFQEEILFWCRTVGCRIGETPILFENRRSGVSKINMGEAVSALWTLLKLGVACATGRIRRNGGDLPEITCRFGGAGLPCPPFLYDVNKSRNLVARAPSRRLPGRLPRSSRPVLGVCSRAGRSTCPAPCKGRHHGRRRLPGRAGRVTLRSGRPGRARTGTAL